MPTCAFVKKGKRCLYFARNGRCFYGHDHLPERVQLENEERAHRLFTHWKYQAGNPLPPTRNTQSWN